MLAMIAVLAACSGDSATAPEGGDQITSLPAAMIVSPRSVTAEVNQPIQFHLRPRDFDGHARFIPTTWRSTGGKVTADGTFMSASIGTFKVIGRGRGWKHADTAIVVVVPSTDSVARIAVSPSNIALSAADTTTFSATAYLPDGKTATVGVTWTATGGDIDAAGAFKAGSTPGTYRVIATNTAGTVADTSTVTISDAAPTEPPASPTEPPASPPAPTLASVYVTPASASIATGATRQFKAYGKNSNGDSIAVAVTFVATGGTVTSSGLYTAGATGGSFRVVAKEPSSGRADTSAVTVTSPAPPPPPPPAPAASTGLGVPFGPFALWNGTTPQWGPAPFSVSIQSTPASTMASMISSARTRGQRLILFIPQGGHDAWKTNGQFDMGKWKSGVDAFATTTIKNAVAQGVADGTVIGSSLIDEPENKDWGGNITKPMLDEMAAYVKARFPTVPVGVNHGGAGSYTWRTSESYKVVDYVISQYNYNATKGDVAAYKRNVLARAAAEGWTPAFSMNVLAGGVPDNDGTYDCAGRVRRVWAPAARLAG